MCAGRIAFLILAVAVVGCSTVPQKPPVFAAPPGSATHHASPYDPLTAQELATAVAVTKASPDFPATGMFAEVSLREPVKGLDHPPREAFLTILDVPRNRTYEAVVDLGAGKRTSWRLVPHAQPVVLSTEYDRYSGIVKADPRFVKALKGHGIASVDEVVVEAWAPGPDTPREAGDDRVMRGLCYRKSGANYYGQPIEGLIPTVDMTTGKLIELQDTREAPIPPASRQLDPASIGAQRGGRRPFVPSQPEGPSFRVNGHEVSWQKWRFHFAMHPRDGLVLHEIRYGEGDHPRSVLHRAALSEMVVPYGDPSPTWAWRNAFDEGEYGLGKMSVSVARDVPANAVLFDADFADDLGKPIVVKSVIGLYERDGGVLWHHSDSDGATQSRRSRELVIFQVATVGNYDYLLSWIFRQDGSLEADVGATGIMLSKGIDDSSAHPGGHRVARGTSAPHHQHFFNYRLDFDVDGEANSVSELNTESVPPGEANPYLNAMRMAELPLRTEKEAARDVRPETGRKWRIYNPGILTALGYHPGYLLVPGENGLPFALPGSTVRKRAGFLDHEFWATRYRPEEQHAAGDYPNQSKTGDGLKRWVRRNGSLEATDLVVWYTMGLTHIPRPEEWPVMPVAQIGFKLLPAGFFDENPALDVPPG